MRIYDQLMQTGFDTFPSDGKPLPKSVWDDLDKMNEAVPIDVANVTDYLAGMGDKKRADFKVRDLPCIVPPFPITFIESRNPRGGEWMWLDEYLSKAIRGWGVLCFVRDLVADFKDSGDSSASDAQESANKFANKIMSTAKHDHGQGAVITTDVRWIVSTYLFLHMQHAHDMVIGPVNGSGIFLQPNGATARLVGLEERMASVTYPMTDFLAGMDDSLAMMIRQLHLPIFFGLSLLHCKNVQLVEQSAMFASRQERRMAQRNNEPPRSKFYTLEIGAMTKTLNRDGQAKQDGIAKALHICRGHFSEYSEEKPLFGKYSGRFWIPAHVRGSAEAGKVVKDYSVKAPKADAA